MAVDKNVTPKATVAFKNLGKGFGKDSVTASGAATFKLKKDKLTATVAVSDQTLRNIKSLKDVVATADYSAHKRLTLNTKYELGPKKYQVGATWSGEVPQLKKAATVKAWYTNKDNLVSGDATLNLTKTQKANITFNQKQLSTAKYSLTQGSFTIEPSYNFAKKAPAVAVTKKQGKATIKASYDLKSEAASLEFNQAPFKVTVASSISKTLKIAKPTATCVVEKVYSF